MDTQYINANEFDIIKFNVPGEIKYNSTSSKQYTIFPKYSYPRINKEAETEVNEHALCIYTDPIEFKKGGLLKVDGEIRRTNDDCYAFWIPLEQQFGGDGTKSLYNLLTNMDYMINNKIDENPDYFGQKKEIEYNNLVKQSHEPPNADVKWKPWIRAKIRIPFNENNGFKKFNIRLVNSTGSPKIIVDSITELRKYFTYGCTAQFLLKIKTFWILKNNYTEKNCGFRITCDTMHFIDNSMKYIDHPIILNNNKNNDEDNFDDNNTCLICLSANKTFICVPCGHVVFCDECVMKYQEKSCPVCRKMTDVIIKVYK